MKFYKLVLAACAIASLTTGALAEENPIKQAGSSYEEAKNMSLKMSSSERKALYMNCSDISSERLLDPNEAARCVGVGDALKEANFGGSFEKLLAWWQVEKEQVKAKGQKSAKP